MHKKINQKNKSYSPPLMINNALNEFTEICKLSKLKLPYKTISVESLTAGKKHKNKITPLTDCQVAIYIFTSKNDKIVYKVGKATIGCNERYRHQHYNPKGAGSTFAKSLVEKNVISGNKKNVNEWIRSNTNRYNILLELD